MPRFRPFAKWVTNRCSCAIYRTLLPSCRFGFLQPSHATSGPPVPAGAGGRRSYSTPSLLGCKAKGANTAVPWTFQDLGAISVMLPCLVSCVCTRSCTNLQITWSGFIMFGSNGLAIPAHTVTAVTNATDMFCDLE